MIEDDDSEFEQEKEEEPIIIKKSPIKPVKKMQKVEKEVMPKKESTPKELPKTTTVVKDEPEKPVEKKGYYYLFNCINVI